MQGGEKFSYWPDIVYFLLDEWQLIKNIWPADNDDNNLELMHACLTGQHDESLSEYYIHC